MQTILLGLDQATLPTSLLGCKAMQFWKSAFGFVPLRQATLPIEDCTELLLKCAGLKQVSPSKNHAHLASQTGFLQSSNITLNINQAIQPSTNQSIS